MSRRKLIVWAAALLASTFSASTALAQNHWVASWATGLMADDPGSRLPSTAQHDVTVRQFVRVSMGGKHLRLRLSNAFGTAPLTIDSIRLAKAAQGLAGGIDTTTNQTVRFHGATTVTIPAGAAYASDPIDLAVGGLNVLAVSFHLVDAPARETVHYISKTTSYVAPGSTSDAPVMPDASPIEHWYQLAGIDVEGGPGAGTIAVLGDSITDGHGSTTDGNDRWTDVLADRLNAASRRNLRAVANLGISGNRLLKDGGGPAGMARLDRDVLNQPGLRTIIVFEGVNDLGLISREGPVTPTARSAVVDGVIAAYAQIIAAGHARGISVIGATILPFGGTKYYRSDANADADRNMVNAWITAPGHFDAVINFDAAVSNPAQPSQLLPAYDTGDRLHPSPTGYSAMGHAVSLPSLVK